MHSPKRPDPPPSARLAGTCHDAKRVWSVLTVTTPTKNCTACPPGSVPADTQRDKESPGAAPGALGANEGTSSLLDAPILSQGHKSRHGADRDSSQWHRCTPTETLRPRQGSNVSVLRIQASCFVPT